jgi:hypothetical protein
MIEHREFAAVFSRASLYHLFFFLLFGILSSYTPERSIEPADQELLPTLNNISSNVDFFRSKILMSQPIWPNYIIVRQLVYDKDDKVCYSRSL